MPVNECLFNICALKIKKGGSPAFLISALKGQGATLYKSH